MLTDFMTYFFVIGHISEAEAQYLLFICDANVKMMHMQTAFLPIALNSIEKSVSKEYQ